MTAQGRDTLRQGLTIFGAIFQIAAGAWAGERAGDIANGFWTPVLPAGYAFLMWTPIFLLGLVFAGWQALPANRERPLLRQVGWYIAAGFIGNGLWEVFFPLEQFFLAQVTIIAIFGVLLAGGLRLVQYARREALANPERWLVAMPFGLYFGWITAAMCVGLATTLTALDINTGMNTAAVAIGIGVLLVGGALATYVIRFSGTGPREFMLAYAAAIIWATIGVAVNQLADSPVTAILALVIAVGVLVLVVIELIGPRRPAPRWTRQTAAG